VIRLKETALVKDTLYAEAARLFNEQGYVATSIDMITKAAKVTKGSFYYYFKDKEEILFLIHKESLAKYVDFAESVTFNQSLTPQEKIKGIISNLVINMVSGVGENWITGMHDSKHLREEHVEEINMLRKKYYKLISSIIDNGIKHGIFKPDIDPKIIAFGLIGMCMWTINWFNPRGEKSPDEIADIFTDHFLMGVGSKEKQCNNK
jgi:AcrR family transcriptional regulator